MSILLATCDLLIERHNAIVDQETNMRDVLLRSRVRLVLSLSCGLLVAVAVTAALQTLDVEACGVRDKISGPETVCFGNRCDGSVREESGFALADVEEAECRIDLRHIVVVAEVGVGTASKRESHVRVIEGVVHACVVDDGSGRQTGDELVDPADALGWAESVTGTVGIVFVECLIVSILLEFSSREEVAKWSEGGDVGIHESFERAEIHHIDGLSESEVCTRKILVQTLLNGGSEDGGPGRLGIVTSFAVFEDCAEVVAEGVVLSIIFTDGQINGDGWGRGRFNRVEAVGEVLGRVDDTLFARRTNERRVVLQQRRITIVELDARVVKLSLTEFGKLIGAKGIFKVLQELVLSGIACHVRFNCLDSRIVERSLGSGRISGAVT